jgi:choline dehydrogenase
VVVCAGAYGTPAILMRSGIGPEAELGRHGIPAAEVLPVGRFLRDHFGVPVRYASTARMAGLLDARAAEGRLLPCNGVVKLRSRHCAAGLWDLHLLTAVFPASGDPDSPDGWILSSSAMLVQPEWTGSVTLRSADPADLPLVTPVSLRSDRDLEAAMHGVEMARRIAASRAAEGLVGEELVPGTDLGPGDIRAAGQAALTRYFHPVGSCPLGPVVDSRARVHGFENLHLADASLMPAIPRANTNLAVVASAERVADLLSTGD